MNQAQLTREQNDDRNRIVSVGAIGGSAEANVPDVLMAILKSLHRIEHLINDARMTRGC